MSTTSAFNAMAQALGTASAAAWPDVVTFKRPINTPDAYGGDLVTSSPTSPANIPARWRPTTAIERTVSDKRISGCGYVIFVPAQFSSALVDVDAKCDVLMSARSGSPAEPSRTFKTHGVARIERIEIKIFCSIEE